MKKTIIEEIKKIDVKASLCLLIAGAIFSAFLISEGAIKTNLVHYSWINGYYDMHGNEYLSCDEVPLFDSNGTKYIMKKAPEGINWYAYFDEDGNQYELENSYVTEEGYFYYDDDNRLFSNDNITSIGSIYYDSLKNKYSKVFEGVYFDKDGNSIHHGGRGDNHVYCFIFR